MFTPTTETGKLSVETVLNAELTDHLGHENNAQKSGSNIRNGYTSKTLLCDDGEIELSISHDRKYEDARQGTLETL